MIAATSILAAAAPAAPGSGKAAPQGKEGVAPFDLKALTEDGAADSPDREETEAPAELAALAGQGPAQLILLQAQETNALAKGEAVAGILEGNTSSIGMDAGLLLPEAPQPGTENEEIMARMPQIIVMDDETENSAAKVTENLSGGNLCPLENTDDAITMADKPEKTEAGQERELFAEAPPRPEALEKKAENRGDTEQKGQSQPGLQPKAFETAQTAQTAAAALSAPANQPPAETELTYIRETIPASLQRLEKLMEGFDGGNKQVKIHLEPEHLGRLSISLSMGPEGLRAKIDTDNPQTQAVLSGEAARLLQKLGESGVKVERMDILCGGEFRQDAQFADSGAFSGQQFAREQKSYATAPEAAGNEGLDLYEIYTQVEEGQSQSSVEYRA